MNANEYQNDWQIFPIQCCMNQLKHFKSYGKSENEELFHELLRSCIYFKINFENFKLALQAESKYN